MSSISRVFADLKSKKEGALIGYVMAGDPAPNKTKDIVTALIKGGIDILELGLPFSDPIADGPTIQAASVRALEAGTTPSMVLDIAKEIKNSHDIPILIMTYYNPIFAMGLHKFFESAKASLVDGIIVPDLPVEEAKEYKTIAQDFKMDTVFLAAPSTTDERLAKIIKYSSGFLYLVSHFGVTGAKSQVADSTIGLLKRVLPFTSGVIPLAVGFGVSMPKHVRELIAAGADGVIVGSVFVNIIKENIGNPEKALFELEKEAQKLKEAT
jgi:tryptophan synthase alpha chain